MTFLEFQTLLAQRLGSLTLDAELKSRIIQETNHVQRQTLEGTGSFMPWFLVSTPQELTLLKDANLLAFPSNYLQELEDNKPWYQNDAGTWTKVVKKSFDYAQEQDLDSGAPQYYAVMSTGYWFSPVADKNYTIRLRYYAREITLTADGDTNAWLSEASDWLLAEVGRMFAKFHVHNPDLEARFDGEATRARQRLFVLSSAKENINRVSQMGED